MIRTPFSASNFHRRRACSGSLEMERNLPDVESEFSVEGQRLHHAAATGDWTGLTEEQIELVKEKIAIRDRFLESVGLVVGEVRNQAQFEKEVPYPPVGEPLFWNHMDFTMFDPRVVVVIDYKFGFEEVHTPDLNEQLAVYIACIPIDDLQADEYYGLIIPRFGKPAPPVRYTREEIPALQKMIEETYAACTPTAPRMPGLKQCRYCKGFQLGVCREAVGLSLETSNIGENGITNPSMALSLMPAEARTRLFDAFKMAADLRMTFTRAVKILLEKDPGFVPGYRLSKEGETRTKITDIQGLRARLHNEMHLGDDNVIPLLSMSNERLKDLIRACTGLKGRELDETIESLTKGLVDVTPVARSLERTNA